MNRGLRVVFADCVEDGPHGWEEGGVVGEGLDELLEGEFFFLFAHLL